MMLSLTVTIIQLAALSFFKIGVSADQTALVVLATCFPAVIGMPPKKKKPGEIVGHGPVGDGVLHKHPPDGCSGCEKASIISLSTLIKS